MRAKPAGTSGFDSWQNTPAGGPPSESQILDAIIEHSDQINLAYLDEHLTIIKANAGCERLSGLKKTDLVGKDFCQTFGDDEVRLVMDYALQSGKSVRLSGRPQGTGSQLAYWDWSIGVDTNIHGQRGLVVSLTDVTDHVRKQDLSEALTGMLMAFVAAQNPTEVFESIVERAMGAMRADCSVVWELEHGTWIPRHTVGCQSARANDPYGETERPLVSEAVKSHKIQYVEDAFRDARSNREWNKQSGTRAFIIMPLVLKTRVLGVLELAYSKGPQRFDPVMRRFLTRLAITASLALERADEFEQERHVSETLRGAVLAMPASIDGVTFAHAYHSSSQASRVGGDLYDVFEIDDVTVGLVVADVSGKGLQAATLTSLVKHTIRARAVGGEANPATVLGAVNDVVLRSSAPEEFVTVFFGILDRNDGRLLYSNAGHTTAVIERTDGSIGRLVTNSPFLGAFADVPITTSEAHMDAGDLLIAYTDGITEARGANGLFGEEGVLKSIGSMRRCSPLEVVERVIEDVLAYSGNALRDDIALLALSLERRRDGRPQQEVLDLDLDGRVPQS